MKPDVLLVSPGYFPAERGGGPIVSARAIAETLSAHYSFRVITSCLDHASPVPLPVPQNEWVPVGSARVLYATPARLWASLLKAISVSDLVHLNSLFSLPFGILPLLLARLSRLHAPIVLSPRGQLSPAALQFKNTRKRLALSSLRATGLCKRILWHATCAAEADEIRSVFGRTATVHVAPNMNLALGRSTAEPTHRKAPSEIGLLRVAFVSRISPKKNLTFAIQMLNAAHHRIEFDIFGSPDDEAYFAECHQLTGSLREGLKVRFRGFLPHDEVLRRLAEYHLFLLPTLGENYCHAIVEAFGAGCPVLISDQTPWRGLAASGIGWDCSLDRPEDFVAAIDRAAAMPGDEFRELSRRALRFSERLAKTGEGRIRTLELYERALAQPHRVVD